jgi:hypothetical protein
VVIDHPGSETSGLQRTVGCEDRLRGEDFEDKFDDLSKLVEVKMQGFRRHFAPVPIAHKVSDRQIRK